MKNLQEKLNKLAVLFDAHAGKLIREECTGKWRGTADYIVEFDNGGQFFLANGCKAALAALDMYIRVYSSFRSIETQAKIKEWLQKNEKIDNMEATEKGLKNYEVIKPSYVRAPGANYYGWFYVLVKVGGKIVPILESGLSCALRVLSLGENDYFSVTDRSKKYFEAGGLKKEEVDFIFRGVGHSSTSKMYKAF